MTTHELSTAAAPALREHVELLERERALAGLAGLDANELYMADLLDELEVVRGAYVGAAVTEIASLRAALDAPLLG